MDDLFLLWYLKDLALSLRDCFGLLSLVSLMICCLWYVIARDDDNEEGIADSKKAAVISAAVLSLCLFIPNRDFMNAYIAVKAGEELAQTEVAQEVGKELKEIYGLTKQYLQKQVEGE